MTSIAAPNPSIERTPSSGLRPLPSAAQVERYTAQAALRVAKAMSASDPVADFGARR